jgi:hypothetical protein
MTPTTMQEKMLKRRGWSLEDCPELGPGEIIAFNRDRQKYETIKDAILICRRLNAREKQARYRARHRDKVNAYAREYKAAMKLGQVH